VLCTFIVIWFNSVQYYVKYIHKYEWRIALLWCCVGRYFNLLWINDVLYSCDVVLVDILIWYEWMTYCTPVMLCLSIFWSVMSKWRSALLWCCVLLTNTTSQECTTPFTHSRSKYWPTQHHRSAICHSLIADQNIDKHNITGEQYAIYS
jgi:hypothetical protein